jgi:hypothetical protein
VRGVGIDGEAQKELVADRDDFNPLRGHGGIIRQLWSPPCA